VAVFELRLVAHIWNTETISVRSDPAHHAFHYRVIAMNRLLVARVARRLRNRPEAQRIHHRHRPCTHREDVPENSAHTGCSPLEGLNERWMVVRLDLERAGPAIADVDDPGIFTGALHHKFAARRQTLEVYARRFIGAVLAPHHAENPKFGHGRGAAKPLQDSLVFVRR